MKGSSAQSIKADRRVSRTRKLLTQALIELTLERGYETLSIRDLAERADIGYATFFRHYKDKEALLLDVLDALIEELLILLQPLSADSDPKRVGTLVFAHAERNSRLYRVLLESHSSAIEARIYRVATAAVLSTSKPKPGSPVPPEIAAHHLVSSFLSLIRWWLEHDRPYPAERMGQVYAELVMNPTREVAFSAEP